MGNIINISYVYMSCYLSKTLVSLSKDTEFIFVLPTFLYEIVHNRCSISGKLNRIGELVLDLKKYIIS